MLKWSSKKKDFFEIKKNETGFTEITWTEGDIYDYSS